MNFTSMNVILVGYMCSGKTSVGSLLAQRLNVPFFDLDQLIEQTENSTISAIFEQKGEVYFRKLERLTLENFLNEHQNYILAAGGGTPCYYDNYKLYHKEAITSVYLKGSIATLTTRILHQSTNRPLLRHLSEEDAKEFVAKHLFDRNFYYNQVTKVVTIDAKSCEEIVSELVAFLA